MQPHSDTGNIDQLYRNGWRQILLVCFRLVLAFLVARAMAFTHEQWGEPYPGDGQDAFEMLMMFFLIGLAVAVIYFGLGCFFQFLFRKRGMLWTMLTDVVLAAILGGCLAYAGATAKYV